MNKRLYTAAALLLALCLTLGLLAGCGNGAPADPAASAAGASSAEAAAQAEPATVDEIVEAQTIGGGTDTEAVGVEDEETGEVVYWPEEYLRDKVVIATSNSAANFKITGRSGGWGSVEMCYGEPLAIVDSEDKVHLQLLKRFDKIDDLLHAETAASPIPEHVEVYEKAYRRFRGFSDALGRLD